MNFPEFSCIKCKRHIYANNPTPNPKDIKHKTYTPCCNKPIHSTCLQEVKNSSGSCTNCKVNINGILSRVDKIIYYSVNGIMLGVSLLTYAYAIVEYINFDKGYKGDINPELFWFMGLLAMLLTDAGLISPYFNNSKYVKFKYINNHLLISFWGSILWLLVNEFVNPHIMVLFGVFGIRLAGFILFAMFQKSIKLYIDDETRRSSVTSRVYDIEAGYQRESDINNIIAIAPLAIAAQPASLAFGSVALSSGL